MSSAAGNTQPHANLGASMAPMNIAALESVIHIEQQAYSHPWSRGNFTDALAAGYQTQLLYQNHELLGYFVAMMGVEEAHLLNLTVAPVHQGRGWARLLLDTLGQWARTQGAQWLWLEVRQSNLRAQQVYAAHGFRQVGERKRYYPAHNGQREDAVVMSLML